MPDSTIPAAKPRRQLPLVASLIETFGWSPALASAATLAIFLMIAAAIVWVVRTNPPRRITITSGPEGSSYQRWAEAYKKALAPHGVTLIIQPSGGSGENLDRLIAPKSGVDIGFVPGGISEGKNLSGLVSLGSVAYQPLWIFYRAPNPITRLAELTGKRVAVGAPGSGTRTLATALLQANGITGAPTTLLDLDAGAAAQALLDNKLDAVFMMGDSASTQTLRSLIRAPGVQLFSFTQADAYVRRFSYLTKMQFPAGSFDLGKNLPAQDMILVGPTIELVAHADLNSALSDLLLEVAKSVHGRASILQKRDEFPAPLEHDFPLSDDAARYYKSGKSFLYRTVHPFWVASLINRILVAVVPLALVIIPAIRFLPTVYRFRIQLRFYRCYRPLLRIEHDAYGALTPNRVKELTERLNEVEKTVDRLRVPASFASQFYELRSHLAFVRQRLNRVSIAS